MYGGALAIGWRFLPGDIRKPIEDANYKVWATATEFWYPPKEQLTAFVQKQLDARTEPSAEMVEAMKHQGFQFAGMIDDGGWFGQKRTWQPVTPQEPQRRVHFSMGR